MWISVRVLIFVVNSMIMNPHPNTLLQNIRKIIIIFEIKNYFQLKRKFFKKKKYDLKKIVQVKKYLRDIEKKNNVLNLPF